MRRTWFLLVGSLRAVLQRLREGNRTLVTAGGEEVGTPELSEWVRCAALLDSVLVPADEYAYLKARLKNALRYSLDGEFGAAAYETRLVLGRAEQLRKQLS